MSASWPPKDWRALIALLGSIGGAASLTLFVWWGVWTLLPAAAPTPAPVADANWWTGATEAHRAETIRWVLWISTGTIALVIVGLGFAINRRSFKGRLGRDGAVIDFEGGEDDDEFDRAPLAIPEPAYGKGAPPA